MIRNLCNFVDAGINIEFGAKDAVKVNNHQDAYQVKKVKADCENTNEIDISGCSKQCSYCQSNGQHFNPIDYSFHVQVRKLDNGRFVESVASNYIEGNDVVVLKVIDAVSKGIWKEQKYESATFMVMQLNEIENEQMVS